MFFKSLKFTWLEDVGLWARWHSAQWSLWTVRRCSIKVEAGISSRFRCCGFAVEAVAGAVVNGYTIAHCVDSADSTLFSLSRKSKCSLAVFHKEKLLPRVTLVAPLGTFAPSDSHFACLHQDAMIDSLIDALYNLKWKLIGRSWSTDYANCSHWIMSKAIHLSR